MKELARCICTALGPCNWIGATVLAFLVQVAYTAAIDATAAGLHSNICRMLDVTVQEIWHLALST